MYEHGLCLRLPLPPGHGEPPTAAPDWQPTIFLQAERRGNRVKLDADRAGVVMGAGVGEIVALLAARVGGGDGRKVSGLILVRSDKIQELSTNKCHKKQSKNFRKIQVKTGISTRVFSRALFHCMKRRGYTHIFAYDLHILYVYNFLFQEKTLVSLPCHGSNTFLPHRALFSPSVK